MDEPPPDEVGRLLAEADELDERQAPRAEELMLPRGGVLGVVVTSVLVDGHLDLARDVVAVGLGHEVELLRRGLMRTTVLEEVGVRARPTNGSERTVRTWSTPPSQKPGMKLC